MKIEFFRDQHELQKNNSELFDAAVRLVLERQVRYGVEPHQPEFCWAAHAESGYVEVVFKVPTRVRSVFYNVVFVPGTPVGEASIIQAHVEEAKRKAYEAGQSPWNV